MLMRINRRVCLMAAMLLISGVISASVVKAQSLPQIRMTPAEVRASIGGGDSNRAGSAGLEGIHTKVLFGNPQKAGYYSILLSVGPHTTIQAHSHRDDRVATVVSGEWHFGHGDHFDAEALKTLAILGVGWRKAQSFLPDLCLRCDRANRRLLHH